MNETEKIIAAAKRVERGFVATVVRTEGSTYRRAGARCVISDRGEVTGTISGGCLEKDLIARSEQWMTDMQPRTITYDSSRDDDIVFGLGLGCRGVIEVRVEPFDAAHPAQIDPAPQRKIAIYGGGPDVEPLAQMAELVGWSAEVVRPRDVHPEKVTPPDADAVVIMTHNYLYDLALLRTMLQSQAKYIGLLGPKSRGDELIAKCGGDRARVYSPAGLNIGGETPEEIALSIVAELQAVLAERDARSLRELEGPLHADDHRPGCRRV
jgi:xanthine/CO dehydrogenase XdhC/CoxF family maturation factor